MAQDLTSTAWRNQQPAGLIPMPKSRSYNAAQGSVSEKLRLDVTGFGVNEVRKLLVGITGEQTALQIQLGNPPQFVSVDNMRGRSVTQAQRRTLVSFGQRLTVQALNTLKRGLVSAIRASTKARTGQLANPANWHYRYVRNGHTEELPLGGASGIPMGPRDFIVLTPVGVVNDKGQAYATAANMRAAGSGRLSFRRSERSKVTRKNQRIGFLALAARAAQAAPSFAGFYVSAGFTSRFSVAGEVTRIGGVRTGFIMIRPKVGRGGRRG